MKLLLTLIVVVLSQTRSYSQDLGTSFWLNDATTVGWTSDSNQIAFAGLRVIVEPKVGAVQSTDDRNPIENNVFGAGGIGFETNLVGALLSAQVMVFAPSEAQFRPESDARGKGLTKNADGRVKTNLGFGVGISMLNGIFAIGYSTTGVSSTQFFEGSQNIPTSIGAWYINIQPVALLKTGVQMFRKKQ